MTRISIILAIIISLSSVAHSEDHEYMATFSLLSKIETIGKNKHRLYDPVLKLYEGKKIFISCSRGTFQASVKNGSIIIDGNINNIKSTSNWTVIKTEEVALH